MNTSTTIEYKICTACKLPKAIENFHIARREKSGRDYECKPCKALRQAAFNAKPETKQRRALRSRLDYQNNPERRAYCRQAGWKHLKIINQDGTQFTWVNYKILLATANKKCMICGTKNPDKRYDWCVDHDHKTNIVRGLLCHKCNRALGNFNDDISLVQKAVNYLSGNLPCES